MSAILDKLPQGFAKQAKRLLAPVIEKFSSLFGARLKGKLRDKARSISAPGKLLSGFNKNSSQVEKLKIAYAKLLHRNTQAEARLNKLERMLSHEELRYSVMLYYQFDSLWNFCHQMLAMQLKNLAVEFEGRERDKMLHGYREQQEKDSKTVGDRVSRLEKERKLLKSQRNSLMQEMSAKKQIWHYFSRKELTRQLEELSEDLEPIERELSKGQNARDKIHSAQAPKLKGVSVITKRAINNHLIAYAQFYYVYFSVGDISSIAKSIRKKSPSEVNFGSSGKCQKFEQLIREKKAKLKGIKGLRKIIAPQTKRIMSQSKYANNEEALPRVNSVACMLSMNNFVKNNADKQNSGKGVVNVVQDNYWDINKLLVR